MAIDPSGNLYGASVFGGSIACYLGCGIIFKLSPPVNGGGWTESVLRDLGNSGAEPEQQPRDLPQRLALRYDGFGAREK